MRLVRKTHGIVPGFWCAGLLLSCVSIWTENAMAWGPLGHQTVVRIAEQFLTNQATKATRALLGTMTLEEASIWPDTIRDDPAYAWVKPLHYANVQEGAPHFELARDCDPTTGCVVSEILSEMRTLNSTTETTQAKQLALKLLVHFVA